MTFENDKAGKFDVLFEGTTGPLGVKCQGLSDTEAGSVLSSGAFVLVKGGAAELPGAIVVLSPTGTHFTCGSVLSVVRGRVDGKVEVNEATAELTIVLKQSGGVNELTSDEAETGIILETSTGGGKFEQSGEETTDSGNLGVVKPKLMD